MVQTLSAISLLLLALQAAGAAERCPVCLPPSGDGPVISPNDLQLHELNSEIRGHVVGPDGEPVEKVEVRLHISNDTAVTARDGSFRFSGLPPGTTELSIDDKRFLPVALPVSAPARDVEVRLTAGSVVRGRLLGCAACVNVMVNARQGRSLRSGWADAEGRYQISQLVPGLVEIETAQERRRPVQTSVVVPPGVPEVRLDIDLPPAFPVREIGRAHV